MNRDEARLRELGLWPSHGLLPGVAGAEGAARSPGPAATEATEATRSTPTPPAKPTTATPALTLPATSGLDWPQLEAAIRGCSACGLCRSRRQAVPGSGAREAQIMIVGEAPGAEEDRRGEPFVGRAGELLDQMLAALRLERRQVYIANVLKCRPPDNRNPAPDEVAACSPFLQRQIVLVRPRVILALGSFAARALLGGDGRIGALRGRVHRYVEPGLPSASGQTSTSGALAAEAPGAALPLDDPAAGVPVVVSYHPAYLLRSPSEKSRAWEDLCQLEDTLRDSTAAA